MVMNLLVANYKISRVLLGAKNPINIMFHDCFAKLSLQQKNLSMAPFTIIGFTRHTTYLKGMTTIHTKVGTQKEMVGR